ncbi:hypothetical protein Tdes44962_MAKER07726 [Teratosphaeria destructans]|uniref:Uncharacterized protein n=1 Tax=Teratosphaeria destructans TaxID=418781 RepID=A0A9W7SYW5_9PEZI|nr:hypothetical protein Tdes44962_MAKER07726 [Teratosphaeria destructans]
MHFPLISFTTAALWDIASASYQPFDAAVQRVINDGYETTRVTRTYTWTHTETSMVTVTRSSPQAAQETASRGTATVVETTFVTILPQSTDKSDMGDRIWYAGQRMHGCDKTACASCRWWLQCRGGEPQWYVRMLRPII